MFDTWMDEYAWQVNRNIRGVVHDQPSLRVALWVHTKVRRTVTERIHKRMGAGGICRGFDKTFKQRCEVRRPFGPKRRMASPKGPGCAAGCLAVHEKCE